MRILIIAYYCIKEVLRDRGTLIEMLAAPILLIFILGSALSGSFTVSEISPSPIAYYGSVDLLSAFNQFVSQPDIEGLLDARLVDSEEDGRKLADAGEVVAFVLLSNTGLTMYSHPQSSFRASIVESVLRTFAAGANIVLGQVSIGITPEPFDFQTGLIREQSVSMAENAPRAIDYYAVAMLVMFLMYGSLISTLGMARDYLEPVGWRLRSTPTRGWELFLGKTLGFIGFVVLQGAVIIGFTKWVYGVNWGDNVFLLFLITLVLALFAVGLGIMVCIVFRDREKSVKLLNIAIPVATFLAGGFMVIPRPGPLFSLAQSLSPNFAAQTAYFNLIYGQTPNEATWQILTLFALAGAVFLIAILLERRHNQ